MRGRVTMSPSSNHSSNRSPQICGNMKWPWHFIWLIFFSRGKIFLHCHSPKNNENGFCCDWTKLETYQIFLAMWLIQEKVWYFFFLIVGVGEQFYCGIGYPCIHFRQPVTKLASDMDNALNGLLSSSLFLFLICVSRPFSNISFSIRCRCSSFCCSSKYSCCFCINTICWKKNRMISCAQLMLSWA